MKLITTTLLLLTATLANAQEIKINAGISSNTAPDGIFYGSADHFSAVNFAGSVSYLHRTGKSWKAGASVSMIGLSSKEEQVYSEDGITLTESIDYKRNYAKQGISFSAVINRYFGGFYLGAAVGYLTTLNKPESDKYHVVYDKGNGFTAGLNIGYEYPINKQLKVGVELSPRYTTLKVKGIPDNANIGYLPVTIGAGWTF